jgi:hypothetical protein
MPHFYYTCIAFISVTNLFLRTHMQPSPVISYAYKKDTPGERHGSQAERLIAAANPVKFKPNTLFSAGRGDSIVQISAPTARYLLIGISLIGILYHFIAIF